MLYNQCANTSSLCKKELSRILHMLNIVALAQGNWTKRICIFQYELHMQSRGLKKMPYALFIMACSYEIYFSLLMQYVLIWICRVTVPNRAALQCTTWSDELCRDMRKCFSCINHFLFTKLNVANSCILSVWVTRVMMCSYWITIIPSCSVKE